MTRQIFYCIINELPNEDVDKIYGNKGGFSLKMKKLKKGLSILTTMALVVHIVSMEWFTVNSMASFSTEKEISYDGVVHDISHLFASPTNKSSNPSSRASLSLTYPMNNIVIRAGETFTSHLALTLLFG